MYVLAWFPSFSKLCLGNSFYWLGHLVLCGPLTGSCCSHTWDGVTCSTNHHRKLFSFSTDCPVPKHPVRVICCTPEAVPEARLTSFSIIMGVVHFIPSARLVDGVGWGLNVVTGTVKGKDKLRTATPNGRLLRPAGGSLGLFFYRYLDGIIIIIIIVIIIIIIIILGLSVMQGIYTHIPETNHVPREH